jgi:hypothetical protein
MQLYRKISGLSILILLVTSLSAQVSDCNITKTFPAKKGAALRLTNKYGDVNFITVNSDSITVCGVITIVQDNKDLVKSNLKLVTIKIERVKDTVLVSTSYDKKFFSEEARQGRKRFSVDYLVKMPSYIDVNLTNEFGNVAVDELSGTVNVRLSQGILMAKKLTKGNIRPLSSIYTDHSQINIEEMNWMALTLFNCTSVDIERAQALTMKSSISKIKLGEVGSLICNSKSDSYNIRSINNLLSESIYSEFEIGLLKGQLKSKATYGSIRISGVSRDFSSIDIVAGQAQVILEPGEGVSFKADISATDASVGFPVEKYPGIVKNEINYSTTLLGITGPDKETKSLIRIRTTAGKLLIQ